MILHELELKKFTVGQPILNMPALKKGKTLKWLYGQPILVHTCPNFALLKVSWGRDQPKA
jgi:hypothetical protein